MVATEEDQVKKITTPVKDKFDYKLIEEYIARPDTPWYHKLRGIELVSRLQRESKTKRK
jgi:hypothetical protein